jgi:hypothetical protein
MDRTGKSIHTEITTMSNSSRIEQATRQHVNAVLTNDQIVDLVKVTFPDWKGGVYASDAAGKRLEDGTITHRGKVAYGDLVLLYENKNSFKVLPTEQIVRRPVAVKKAKVVSAPVVTPAPVAAPTPAKPAEPAAVAAKGTGKGMGKASQPPVATKRAGRDVHA